MNKKKKIIAISLLTTLVIVFVVFLNARSSEDFEELLVSEAREFVFSPLQNYETENYPLVVNKEAVLTFKAPPGWSIKKIENDQEQLIEVRPKEGGSCLVYVAVFEEQYYAQHLLYKIERVFNSEDVDYSIIEEDNRWGVLYENGYGLIIRFPVDSSVYEIGYQDQEESEKSDCQQAFYKLLSSVKFKND